MTKEDILQAIEGMTVLELSELIKAMEEKFGVSAAAPVAMAVPGAVVAADEEAEQTEFDVVITSAGQKKIAVIKVVRELTGLSLKDAKELVDNAPKAVKEGISRSEAEDAKTQLEEAGAIIDIK